jgi:hypothetical protein
MTLYAHFVPSDATASIAAQSFEVDLQIASEPAMIQVQDAAPAAAATLTAAAVEPDPTFEPAQSAQSATSSFQASSIPSFTDGVAQSATAASLMCDTPLSLASVDAAGVATASYTEIPLTTTVGMAVIDAVAAILPGNERIQESSINS